ncbi:interferon-inducible GTPase 5-like [Colossoma macropomum]|uniref:interferon-inducible GTPase 5-like n=1 Tax=Colossoma macropomum TaxID=42526 RepID=UPI001864C049|nr:interferon-inducible GTPase 5-like [Colossoma macropomum]
MTSRSSDESAAIQASEEPTLQRATKKAQKQIDSLFNISLNVAVTGESGTGKSTFINAFRNLNVKDEGAAKAGVTETTTEPTPYTHPTMPNVVFWDLPGIGSPNFKAKTYIKEMKFDKYDFFLIISSSRFKENDLMLAKKIKKRKKQFYFIRSKIDVDIASDESINEEETLLKIRRDCEENLKDVGNPKVFLINSRDLYAFDFEELVKTLNSELPQHKQDALLLSVPVSSVAILEKKVKIFEKAIWAAAFLSGGIAAAPVPGLSFACDMAIVGSFFTKCYHAFGLDDKSLEKLSERLNKPHLKTLEKSPLLTELAEASALRMGTSAIGEFLCSLIPVAGSVAAAAISFTTTHDLLQKGLKELADEARKVLREAGLQ